MNNSCIFFFKLKYCTVYCRLFIFAAITIYFGVNLEKSNTPEEASYIVIAYIITYVIIEVILECQKYYRRNEGTIWWLYIFTKKKTTLISQINVIRWHSFYSIWFWYVMNCFWSCYRRDRNTDFTQIYFKCSSTKISGKTLKTSCLEKR